MRTSRRRLLIVALVGCFSAQTAMVYLDDTGRETPPLSATAQLGWRVWHENNCQSCHQLFGFGGFLGPDLTNAIHRLAPERLRTILTVGEVPMPAFGLTQEEIDGVTAFLTEIDATGTGQLRLVVTPPPAELLDGIVTTVAGEEPLGGDVALGRQVVKNGKCISCHLPFEQSTQRAPDLRKMIETPGAPGILATLEDGRVARGMPPFSLSSDEQQGVLAFLTWMRDNGDAIGLQFEAAAEAGKEGSEIPWFEYRR